jgi:predicted DsbA family dithiol-disulfide isomerase/uncharacterized membrane protein
LGAVKVLPVRKTLPFWAVIAICAVALVASSLLLVDYVRPEPVFCDAEGGCGIMKRTAFARPYGIPMPYFGIGGFLAIGLAQLLPGRRARITQAMLAVFGAIVALGLIGVQASMKTVCPYCAVADSAGVVLAVLSVLRAIRGWDPPAELRGQRGIGVATILASVVIPVSIGMNKKPLPPEVPQVIREEMKKTPKGKVTVVDFVDFECPFCRMTHAEFSPLVEQRRDKLRVLRKNVPLRMHPHAQDAARTACCGDAQGKGDEIAEALFATEPTALTPQGCEELAAKHGLDMTRFRDCVKDPATDASIHSDGETFRAAHGHGLPTIYIDGVKLEGSQEPGVLEHTLDTAISAL